MTFIERQALAAELIALKPGEEKVVGDDIWFRIDRYEFKVSTGAKDRDILGDRYDYDKGATWCRAITRDVVDSLSDFA